MEKMAFIICYNNDVYMNECMKYISWLKVPDGIETDVIGIKDAPSMAAGYNAAMLDVKAKYKVYMHQDVLILNQNFISDVIEIFEKNQEYGMLGVVGSDKFIEDANYWMQWNVGAVDADNFSTVVNVRMKEYEDIQQVYAIDGMIMITQYDIKWREDIFDGFDFYDVSQSAEFQMKGYKIGVPHQKSVWCSHVCGYSKLTNYEKYRKKFCDEYKNIGYKYRNFEENDVRAEKNNVIVQILPEIKKLWTEADNSYFMEQINIARTFYKRNSTLQNYYAIACIALLEEKNDIKDGFIDKTKDIDMIVEKYTMYRFLFKRMEYKKSIDDMVYILQDLSKDAQSGFVAERVIAELSVLNPERIVRMLEGTFCK